MSIRPIFSRFNTVFGIIFLMISTIIGCFLLTFTQSIGVFYAISLLIGITNAGTEYFESLTCLIMFQTM